MSSALMAAAGWAICNGGLRELAESCRRASLKRIFRKCLGRPGKYLVDRCFIKCSIFCKVQLGFTEESSSLSNSLKFLDQAAKRFWGEICKCILFSFHQGLGLGNSLNSDIKVPAFLFEGSVLNWFSDFTTNRSFFVRVGTKSSMRIGILSGII